MGPDRGMFRALIERCPLVTYVADADGAITYICPQIEEWTGRASRLWVDDPTFWHTMIHPEDFDRVDRGRPLGGSCWTSSTGYRSAAAAGSGSGSARWPPRARRARHGV